MISAWLRHWRASAQLESRRWALLRVLYRCVGRTIYNLSIMRARRDRHSMLQHAFSKHRHSTFTMFCTEEHKVDGSDSSEHHVNFCIFKSLNLIWTFKSVNYFDRTAAGAPWVPICVCVQKRLGRPSRLKNYLCSVDCKDRENYFKLAYKSRPTCTHEFVINRKPVWKTVAI